MTIKNINKKIIRLLAVEFIQLSMPVIGNIIAQNCIYDLPAALAVRNYYYSFLVSIILILVNQIPQGILYQIYLVFTPCIFPNIGREDRSIRTSGKLQAGSAMLFSTLGCLVGYDYILCFTSFSL